MHTQWGNYSSNMYSLEAIDRIRNHNQNEEPLFLYLGFQSVHSANPPEYPLQPPGGWLNKFENIKHDGRRHYAAMVGAMDDAVGRVIIINLYPTIIANCWFYELSRKFAPPLLFYTTNVLKYSLFSVVFLYHTLSGSAKEKGLHIQQSGFLYKSNETPLNNDNKS